MIIKIIICVHKKEKDKQKPWSVIKQNEKIQFLNKVFQWNKKWKSFIGSKISKILLIWNTIFFFTLLFIFLFWTLVTKYNFYVNVELYLEVGKNENK